MVNLTLTIVLSILNILTFCLHALGGYLLKNLSSRHGMDDIHNLFLINLSAAESILNILQFFINLISYLTPHDHIVFYLKAIRGYGFVNTYFLTMIFLTLDRLLDIALNIKYHLYVNRDKVRRLLVGSWVVNALVLLSVFLIHIFTAFDVNILLSTYIYPTFDICFIFIAFITYGFIFHKYKKTRVPPVTLERTKGRQNFIAVFKASRFYIPVLLITTFLTFMVIGDMIYLVAVVINGNNSFTLIILCHILFALSYLSDAIIYILIKPSVKKMLWRKFKLHTRLSRMEGDVHPSPSVIQSTPL